MIRGISGVRGRERKHEVLVGGRGSRFGIASACLLALLACLGIGAPSASAVDKAVNGSFGETGFNAPNSGPPGRVTTPAGIAVNQADGRVYIGDNNNNNSRVTGFTAEGLFDRTWGKNVIAAGPGDTGEGFEICVAGTEDECRQSNAGAGLGGEMRGPNGVAVDAAGNVYIADQNNLRVQKFDPDGNFLLAFGKDVIVNGSASDPTGITTTQVCEVAEHCQGGNAGERGGEFATTFSGHLAIVPDGAAVNAGNLLVADPGNRRVQEFTPDGEFVRAFGWDVTGISEIQQLAVDATGGSYQLTFDGDSTGATASGDISNVSGTGDLVRAPTSSYTRAAGNPTLTNVTNIASFVVGMRVTGTGIPAAGAWVIDVNEGENKLTLDKNATGNGNATNLEGGAIVNAAGGPFVVGQPLIGAGIPANTTILAVFGSTITPSNLPTAAQTGVSFIAGSTTVANLASVSGSFVVGQAISGAGIAPGTTITACAPNCGEPTSLTISAPPTTTDTEVALTAAIPFNATAAVLANILAALPSVGGPANVAVSGSPAAGYTVTFQGALLGMNFDPMTADEAGLTGGAQTATIETIQDGAGGTVTDFEVCTNAALCKEGAASGAGVGQFATATPTRVAADSAGSIYTVEPTTNFRVQKFTVSSPGNVITPQGTFAEDHTKGTAAANSPLSVAVDPANQNVLVVKAFPAGSTASCPTTEAPSVAERRIVEVSSSGTDLEATHIACAGLNAINAITVRGSTGDIFASSTEGPAGAPAIYGLNTPLQDPAVSFNTITNITHNSAEVSGFVSPNGPAGVPYGPDTTYQFLYKRSVDATFTELAPVSAGKGTTAQLVSVKLPALTPGTSYDVQLVVDKAFVGTFATDVVSFSTLAAKPEVGVPSATTAIDPETGEARAALYGKVNPNGKETTYRFEYGTTTSYGTKVPVPDASVGSGSADVSVAQFIDGLQPATTYHFRLLAKSINGTTASADRTFTTPPVGAPGNCDNEAVRAQQGIADTVPDCRAYELVSPADKGGSGSVASFDILVGQLQIHVQASQAGGAAVYPIQNGIPESTAGGLSRWHAKRVDEGWQQQQVSGPSLIEPTKSAGGDSFALPSLVQFASPDLSCAIVRSYNPLTEDTPQAALDAGMENLYRWDADDGSYELISNVLPANPAFNIVNGALYSQIDASDDCKRVFFISHYRFIPGASGLYEWGDGVLRDAGVLPNGGLGVQIPGSIHPEYLGGGPQRAVSGGEVERPSTARWNAVSPDGHRFFFTAIANQGPSTGRPAIFMREVDENGNVEVVEVSASQTGVPTNGARFETASPDANKVVFRANYGIAATTSAGPTNARCGPIVDANANVRETDHGAVPSIEIRSCDLYAYDVETGELTDISADPNPADPVGAQAQGAVAIDEDGSHIYFATLGQLIPGKGSTYAQNTAGDGSANIYLWNEGELSYVVTLDRGTDENADLFGGGPATTSSLYGVMMRVAVRWRAETSADGSRLLFPASANLTGNAAGGGKKAYLYSAEAEELTCVSCPPDGSPTLVTEDGRLAPLPSSAVASREPAGLLTRARRAGLTYRASSMSEDGSRVFFASLDALAPGAISGERNVYQWHQGKVSFLAIVKPSGAGGYAELFDVSADGKDVLIATNQQLVPQDKDTVSDLYNVRVDGGFLYEEPAPACQVDEAVPLIPDQIYCQGAASAQPGAVGLASPGFFGPGNPGPAGQPARRCNRQQVRRGKRCIAKRALARRACAKRKGKAKRRCVANQMRRLNRVQQRQWRQQQRRANANRGGAR